LIGSGAVTVHRSSWADLDPLVLHDIVRLRVDVFVVEQRCPYPELDGRDVEAGTEHVWTTDGGGVSAYLRVLAEPGGARRIGRVVTRADARGAGLSARLVADVVARHADVPLVLDAQTYLTGFYAGFSFVATGPEFLDDGIGHVPMLRDPSTSGRVAGMSTDPTDPGFPEPADPDTDPLADDRDLTEAGDSLDERDDPQSLATDGLTRDVDDDTWEAPQRPSVASAEGYTPSEEAGRESIDDRLLQEEPEPDPAAAGQGDADHDLRET